MKEKLKKIALQFGVPLALVASLATVVATSGPSAEDPSASEVTYHQTVDQVANLNDRIQDVEEELADELAADDDPAEIRDLQGELRMLNKLLTQQDASPDIDSDRIEYRKSKTDF